MLPALLLAGVCATMPLFDVDGPPCVDQTIECHCSECWPWDAAANATSYEVDRKEIASGVGLTVGTVMQGAWTDEDGETHTYLGTLWCAGWDSSFPQEGVAYRYRVRACNALGCGGWSNTIDYVAAPYSCWDGGSEVPCYVGAPLRAR